MDIVALHKRIKPKPIGILKDLIGGKVNYQRKIIAQLQRDMEYAFRMIVEQTKSGESRRNGKMAMKEYEMLVTYPEPVERIYFTGKIDVNLLKKEEYERR